MILILTSRSLVLSPYVKVVKKWNFYNASLLKINNKHGFHFDYFRLDLLWSKNHLQKSMFHLRMTKTNNPIKLTDNLEFKQFCAIHQFYVKKNAWHTLWLHKLNCDLLRFSVKPKFNDEYLGGENGICILVYFLHYFQLLHFNNRHQRNVTLPPRQQQQRMHLHELTVWIEFYNCMTMSKNIFCLLHLEEPPSSFRSLPLLLLQSLCNDDFTDANASNAKFVMYICVSIV